LFVPVVVNVGVIGMFDEQERTSASLTTVTLSMVFVGLLAAINLANQFGFDGSAYAANLVAGVTGREELRARIFAYSTYVAPLLVVITLTVGALLGRPQWVPAMLGSVIAAYGSALAIVLFVSVFGAYALPETSNPFAINTAGGTAKSLLSLVVLVVAGVAAIPIVAGAFLLGSGWLWIGLPVGAAYGVGAALLGAYLAGDVLDRRMPELLATVTPRR
ncbi:MAG TPA: ABC transporter permease, partial [Catenuloplanes sp.]